MRTKRGAVEDALNQVFDRSRCASPRCDRRPLGKLRFCGSCLDDRQAGRVVIFRGGEMLPAREEDTKLAYGGHKRERQRATWQ
ncbi:MAG TPA: hypothetical protein VI703_06910 [Anaerolineales bacterium]|nr:hypothetical protein [Anaerolineales bacterium]